MEFSEEIALRIAELCVAWNRAEKAIKLAEQVNSEIVNPAVYELRYAGRRLIEVFENLEKGNEREALSLLRDAHFDCTRSRHDAIDAGTSKIAADLEIAVSKLGRAAVLEAFPKITQMLGQLSAVRMLIAISREDRENREKIYASVESDNLSQIVSDFGEFQASEPLFKSYVWRQRRSRWIERALGAAAIIAVLVTWYLTEH